LYYSLGIVTVNGSRRMKWQDIKHSWRTEEMYEILGCIQKFPDWQPGAKTANGIALCH
jgi:hypothetical protein